VCARVRIIFSFLFGVLDFLRGGRGEMKKGTRRNIESYQKFVTIQKNPDFKKAVRTINPCWCSQIRGQTGATGATGPIGPEGATGGQGGQGETVYYNFCFWFS
jgi:hypothetical protein